MGAKYEQPDKDSPNIQKLWEEYAATKKPEIREMLISIYMPLVKLVAGRIAINLPQHIDKDDLISVGFFGLIDSIEKYDYTRGIKFETYAYMRIRGAILDSLRAQDWLPTALRQKAKNYEQTLASLEHELGRAATEEEIAARMKISVSELQTLINHLNSSTIIPLEEFVQSGTSLQFEDRPLEYVQEKEVKTILAKAIDKLPEKEKLLVSLYYYEGLTLKEISVAMKLSPARISQLHTMAIYRMRGALSRLKSSIF